MARRRARAGAGGDQTLVTAANPVQPAVVITTPLSFGHFTRQAKPMSLTSPALASNAHSSTPRLSRRLVVVGGVDDGNISTTISSFSLTGKWSSIAILIGKSWPLRTVVLKERSSVFDVVTSRPAE